MKALLKAVLSVMTLYLSSDLRHEVIPKGSQFTLSHVTGQWFRSAAQIILATDPVEWCAHRYSHFLCSQLI